MHSKLQLIVSIWRIFHHFVCFNVFVIWSATVVDSGCRHGSHEFSYHNVFRPCISTRCRHCWRYSHILSFFSSVACFFLFLFFSFSWSVPKISFYIRSIVAKRATATTQTEWNRNTRANMKRREERTGSTMRTQNVHTSINIRIICLYKV